MKHKPIHAAALVLALACLPTLGAWAQANSEAATVSGDKVMPARHTTDGVIKKVNLEAGKLTIAHSDIKHLGMPAMTMVFPVKDKAMLDKVHVGDKVKFIAERESGHVVVTDIQLRK